VVEVADKMVSCSKPVGLVADHLGFVVEPFNGAVIDGHVKPSQDVLFMASNHLGKLAHGFETQTPSNEKGTDLFLTPPGTISTSRLRRCKLLAAALLP